MKKIIAILLCLSVFFVALVSCEDKNEPVDTDADTVLSDTDGDTDNETEKDTAQDTEKETEKETEKDISIDTTNLTGMGDQNDDLVDVNPTPVG